MFLRTVNQRHWNWVSGILLAKRTEIQPGHNRMGFIVRGCNQLVESLNGQDFVRVDHQQPCGICFVQERLDYLVADTRNERGSFNTNQWSKHARSRRGQ